MDLVWLDPAKLRQVVLNYLSNAIKFSRPGDSVLVHVRQDARLLRLEVSDGGPGIAPRDHDRVFFEFEQLHGHHARRGGGTGLGLAVTKRLVEAQGGRVGVVSEVGRGSTFFAEVPLTDGAPMPLGAEVHRIGDTLTARVAGAAA
jgi:signal transduction histidine kinase